MLKVPAAFVVAAAPPLACHGLVSSFCFFCGEGAPHLELQMEQASPSRGKGRGQGTVKMPPAAVALGGALGIDTRGPEPAT